MLLVAALSVSDVDVCIHQSFGKEDIVRNLALKNKLASATTDSHST